MDAGRFRRPGEVVVRSPLKVLLITGSLVAASLGGAASAAAATAAPPTLMTANFACSNGVCEVGPGNAGMSFAAGLDAAGQQCGTEGGTTPEVTGVASGSLPPGLQFVGPGQQTQITGTPAKAGTYAFAVQLANVNDASGQLCGPTATQQLTITIGTGSSDRAVIKGAGWDVHTGVLAISGYDANIGALWSVSVTSTGRVLISSQPRTAYYPIDGSFVVRKGMGYPCPLRTGCDLTVTNNLGSSVTVLLGKPIY
jgi:hypothetical protein